MAEATQVARDYSDMASRLSDALTTRLHIKGGSLQQQLRRTGRRAPRWVRQDMRVVAEAETLAAHPKLASRVQRDEVEAAFRRAEGWLHGIDPAARRRQFLRAMAAGLVFNLLLLAGIGITLLAVFDLIGPGAAGLLRP